MFSAIGAEVDQVTGEALPCDTTHRTGRNRKQKPKSVAVGGPDGFHPEVSMNSDHFIVGIGYIVKAVVDHQIIKVIITLCRPEVFERQRTKALL